MSKPFPFTKRIQSHDFVKLTNEWINKYRDSDDDFDKERVKIKQLYLDNRDNFLKNNRGFYVFVTQNEFVTTNFTVMDSKNPNPVKDTWGIWFKVGEEFGPPTNALFSSSVNGSSAFLPISFGQRGSSFWYTCDQALVDTGCNTTTLDASVLRTIKDTYPLCQTGVSSLDVIGDSIEVESGTIDIDFCGRQYSIRVNFAKLPCLALIGMDLINDGNLFYDPNKWISFTRH